MVRNTALNADAFLGNTALHAAFYEVHVIPQHGVGRGCSFYNERSRFNLRRQFRKFRGKNGVFLQELVSKVRRHSQS